MYPFLKRSAVFDGEAVLEKEEHRSVHIFKKIDERKRIVDVPQWNEL